MSKTITHGIHLHSLFMGMKYVVIWSPQYVYCVCNNCRFYKHIILSIRIKTSPNSNLWKNSSRALSPELWPLMRCLAATNSRSKQNIWFELDFLKKQPLYWGNWYSLSFVYILWVTAALGRGRARGELCQNARQSLQASWWPPTSSALALGDTVRICSCSLGFVLLYFRARWVFSNFVPTLNYLILRDGRAQNTNFARRKSFCRFFLNNNYFNFIFLASWDNHCHHKMNRDIPQNSQEICKHSNSFWLAPQIPELRFSIGSVDNMPQRKQRQGKVRGLPGLVPNPEHRGRVSRARGSYASPAQAPARKNG